MQLCSHREDECDVESTRYHDVMLYSACSHSRQVKYSSLVRCPLLPGEAVGTPLVSLLKNAPLVLLCKDPEMSK